MIWDTVAGIIKDTIDRVIPDKTQAAQAKAALDQLKESGNQTALENDLKLAIAGMDNVKAEATGSSWLQRNWRPMTALAFVTLVIAYFLGFTAPNLAPDAVDKLFGLIQLCLGGYTIGRTVEKIAPHVADAVSALKSK